MPKKCRNLRLFGYNWKFPESQKCKTFYKFHVCWNRIIFCGFNYVELNCVELTHRGRCDSCPWRVVVVGWPMAMVTDLKGWTFHWKYKAILILKQLCNLTGSLNCGPLLSVWEKSWQILSSKQIWNFSVQNVGHIHNNWLCRFLGCWG